MMVAINRACPRRGTNEVTVQTHPLPDSYWVIPGRLLAGEYPGSKIESEVLPKLRKLLAAGVTFFVDLTEAGVMVPYARILAEEAASLGAQAVHTRMGIRDMGIPTPAFMTSILSTIDDALEAGHVVYVHCWGGIGRTGTVVGCYLVQHGMTGRQAIEEIERLRQGTPDGDEPSPQTDEQLEMILSWPVGQRQQA